MTNQTTTMRSMELANARYENLVENKIEIEFAATTFLTHGRGLFMVPKGRYTVEGRHPTREGLTVLKSTSEHWTRLAPTTEFKRGASDSLRQWEQYFGDLYGSDMV